IGAKIMAKPLRQMPYETLGDVLVTFADMPAVQNYRRELNLDTAVARVAFSSGDVKFEREVFVSPVDQVIVARLGADHKGRLSFTVRIKSPQKSTVETDGPNTLILKGVNGRAEGIQGALKFEERLRVLPTGGVSSANGDSLSVSN